MERFMPYAAIERGAIVSALFGERQDFGPLTAVEFTLSATAPSARGLGLTAALAARIKAEAESAFDRPLMLAETIAAPVMRSCHDLGMKCRGVLPAHYRIGVGERLFTNLYLWSS
jgi:GNAT superfamily N-acetyltransferase